MIGERGLTLSGGQQARLALATALYAVGHLSSWSIFSCWCKGWQENV